MEILIAFAILALSIGILLKIFSGGVNTAAISEEYTAAAQIAESLMVKTGVETTLQPGETQGDENEKYHWRVTVSPFEFNPDNVDVKTLKTELYRVIAIVTWDDGGGGERQIELTTLKLINKLQHESK